MAMKIIYTKKVLLLSIITFLIILKVSYTMELEAMGFDFVVLPNVFAIHMPHAPSLDIPKFRSSDNYRR